MADWPGFTDMEQDALAELFNIGIGHAASAMNQLLNEELTLSVPRIEVTPHAAIADALRLHGKQVCDVHQSVSGLLGAHAHLLFPEEQSLELVRLMLGDSYPEAAMTEMQQEALCEIGNIIINACIGAMANALGNECTATLPTLYQGTIEQVLVGAGSTEDQLSLVIYIDFYVEKHEIRGYLVFLLDSVCLADLKTLLAAFLRKLSG